MKKFLSLLLVLSLTGTVAFGLTKASEADYAWGSASITVANAATEGPQNDLEIKLYHAYEWGKSAVYLGDPTLTNDQPLSATVIQLRNNRVFTDDGCIVDCGTGLPVYKMKATDITGPAENIFVTVEQIDTQGLITTLYTGLLSELNENADFDYIGVGYTYEDGTYDVSSVRIIYEMVPGTGSSYDYIPFNLVFYEVSL